MAYWFKIMVWQFPKVLFVVTPCKIQSEMKISWTQTETERRFYFHLIFKEPLPSVLWHCWLGVRRSIRPVKIKWWGVGVVICLQRGADCLHMVQLMPLHPKTPSTLASFKSRLVLPFWYQLTRVVQEKRPIYVCSVVLVVLRNPCKCKPSRVGS